jgi:protein required for attachment to host cells
VDKLDRLPPGAVVLICDARKALIFRNDGAAFLPRLETEAVIETDEATSESQRRSDRPGRRLDRTAAGIGIGQRSAMEQTDQHALQIDRFAAEVMDRLQDRHGTAPIEALVVAAPASMLGALRDRTPAPLRAVVLAEFSKDLTQQTAPQILQSIFNA